MTSDRKRSLTVGLLYILTFVSIPTLVIYAPVKSPGYILGAGPDTSAIIGAVSEIIIAFAGIGTAVVLYPILKKQNGSMALALVAARIVESSAILVGVAFILSIVTLRQTGAGEAYLAISHSLAILYDRMFFLSQSFMPAICDILLGTLLYQSRLVPRPLSMIGIIGGPLLLVGYFAAMFGLLGQHDALAGLSAILVAIFEFALGLWLIFKGFNTKAVSALEVKK